MSWKRCWNEKIELVVADVPTSSAIEEILCESSISMVLGLLACFEDNSSTDELNRPVAERDPYCLPRPSPRLVIDGAFCSSSTNANKLDTKRAR